MGAKRPLNGTSKVNTQTDRQTHGRTFRLIESIGPKGRCFEKQQEIANKAKIDAEQATTKAEEATFKAAKASTEAEETKCLAEEAKITSN